MVNDEILREIKNKFETGEIVKIPSMKHLSTSQWVVYFYEDGIIRCAIYYTEERARTRLESEKK